MSTWQPIETAPKDEHRKLLWIPERGVQIGHWDDDRYAAKPRPLWIWNVWRKADARSTQPTHWQPLPAPPAQEQSR